MLCPTRYLTMQPWPRWIVISIVVAFLLNIWRVVAHLYNFPGGIGYRTWLASSLNVLTEQFPSFILLPISQIVLIGLSIPLVLVATPKSSDLVLICFRPLNPVHDTLGPL